VPEGPEDAEATLRWPRRATSLPTSGILTAIERPARHRPPARVAWPATPLSSRDRARTGTARRHLRRFSLAV